MAVFAGELTKELITLREAAAWASEYMQKNISVSNISYLVQYGKIRKYYDNGSPTIKLDELKKYYKEIKNSNLHWESKIGDDVNWELSFKEYREKDTTKHVHRLHPFKGKFIPQLVEYFIDEHTDSLKKEKYFNKNDVILDPFMGSGTTLIQANEQGIHSIGIDISPFNCLITKCKTRNHNLPYLSKSINHVLQDIDNLRINNNYELFEEELNKKLNDFNNKYFPGYQFKFDLANGLVDEESFIPEKENEFLSIYLDLVKKYNIVLKQDVKDTFLDKWFIRGVREEIEYIKNKISGENDEIKEVLQVILSRTVRSCRATTHSDLATLKEPQLTSYYCHKHKKICKPIFSMKQMFKKYAKDTLSRLAEYRRIKTDASSYIINDDSRTIDVFKAVKTENPQFYQQLQTKKIKGIFTSPPYVGQIDYHEQHAYAYELFDLQRFDEKEIGPLFKGQGQQAKEDYVKGISQVLNNCRRFLTDDFDIFIVANDKYNLYPEIARLSSLSIVNQFKRPVLNRTERDKNPYSEFIFHMKDKNNG